ncbi:lipocalin-like domain-containing protein [Vibrio cincinnatiensis]|uniref:lipocalin-like domain-containing protein n=1 Tax=Vibrio cincinnatiensis TaxID=675 RepID=UPI001EDF5238|nr:carotenoid 1,2-hydratase [Vibrio cincinnatiensis]
MKKVITCRVFLILAIVSALLGAVVYRTYPHFLSETHSSLESKSSRLLLSNEDQRFALVSPDKSVRLPQDFAIHPEYQHEWWHVFANVRDAKGEEYGVQWNYFRVANDDRQDTGWHNSQLFISHVVISNTQQSWKDQRIARGGIGQADMTQQPFRLWIDNWQWRSLGSGPLPSQLMIETDNFGASLQLVANGPYVLPGENGYQSRDDHSSLASYSIYAPFISVKGKLQLDPYSDAVSVVGEAWVSKVWGSGLLGEGQQGWDWFVLHLDNSRTLTVIRHRYRNQRPYLYGTLAMREGRTVVLSDSEINISSQSASTIGGDKVLPLQWNISVPSQNIHITTKALNPNLWLPFALPYWEGPIHATGTHEARGFMQLTGY